MNKNVYIILLLITSQLIIPYCNAKQRFPKIKSFFNNYKLEKVEQKELPLSTIDTISIHNINGPITIKTGWKKNSLFLKTTKRARRQEGLDNSNIVIDSSKNNHLSITTKQLNQKLTTIVEYELIIPASLNVALHITDKGEAFIKDVHGTINVTTNDTITISNSQQTVAARTLKKGSIFIANSSGPVHAHSFQGNIIGENIANSFSAHSKTGKVAVAYKTVPCASTISLETICGNISLALPIDTNAEIRGHTAQGTLVSDHYITLRPYATQLNTVAWNKFKKEVDGVLGSGQATIALRSTKGNVKIIEAKTT